jgi:hypothetical protein
LAAQFKRQEVMIRKHFIPLGLQVAFGFGAFMALIAATMYCVSLLQSPDQGCIEHCATLGKNGSLVSIYRWEQTAGMRGTGPTECRCS